VQQPHKRTGFVSVARRHVPRRSSLVGSNAHPGRSNTLGGARRAGEKTKWHYNQRMTTAGQGHLLTGSERRRVREPP